MEGDREIQIRFEVNDNYDTILLAVYDSSIVKLRVLEDDKTSIYGVSGGLLTYETTMGANLSIPGVSIDKIEQ